MSGGSTSPRLILGTRYDDDVTRPRLVPLLFFTASVCGACSLFLDDLSEEGKPGSTGSDGGADRTVATPDATDDDALGDADDDGGTPPPDVPKDTLNCALPQLLLCDGFEDDDLLDAAVGDWDRSIRFDAGAGATSDAAASGTRSFLLEATGPAPADEFVFLSADGMAASPLREVVFEADVFLDPSAATFASGQEATIIGVQPAASAGFANDALPRVTVVVGPTGVVTARVRTFGNDKEKTIALPMLTLGAWKRVFIFMRFHERNGRLFAKVDGVTAGDMKALLTAPNTPNPPTFTSVALALNRSVGTPGFRVRFDNVHVRTGQ